MRNLKKILALVLALVMVVGLMATASAASYTDEAQVSSKYAEAVEVLSGIGVFRGTGDGSTFSPKATITRAEVAAIVYRVMSTDVTDAQDGIYADYNEFDDVDANAWYAGYVNYAANGEYIKGDGAGKFYPMSNVTGYQVLAIMLRAIGYGQNGEFEGQGWEVRVATLAKDLGITTGVTDGTLGAVATRELVAYLLFNAIAYVPTVTYTPALGYNPYTNIFNRDENDTLGEKKFGLIKSDRFEIDVWGRPGYIWYGNYDKIAGYNMYYDALYAVIEESALATYTTAVADCQIAADQKQRYDYVTDVYTNGVLAEDDPVDVSAQAKTNGGQGVQIEVYKDRVVRIDTYLAKVGTVTREVKDKLGHVIVEAETALTVYKTDITGTAYTMEGADYARGDMILVNVCEGNTAFAYTVNHTVYDVAKAAAFVGTQTDLYFNTEKHEIDEKIYNDAEKFYLDPAGYNGGKWTWYMDQFGNLIGNAEIIDPSSYGVIKSIQWINADGVNGYAKAVIVDMTGAESVMKVAYIDGCKTVYGAWYGADFDRTNKIAEISTNIADNYTEYCGLDLYEIKETAAGAILTAVDEVNPADVATGVPVIAGTPNVLVDNDTMYLIRKATSVAGVYTFAPVTGYENVADYTDCVVDYVNLDSDSVAEYVYITGTADYTVGSEYVYITNDWDIHATLNGINNVYYYTVTGVVRADGSTDPLYVDGSVAAETLVAWLGANVDKLFKVTTVEGFIFDLSSTYLTEVTSVDQAIGNNYAYFAGSVSVIGNGMIVTEDGMVWNVNSTTTVANVEGKGTLADLTYANLAGKYVYVVGSSVGNTYVAKAIFITSLDSLNAAKELAIAELKSYINAEVAALDASLTNAAADATTSMAATGWGTGYETMAAVVAKWSSELNAQTSVAAVEAKLAAQKSVFDSAEAAKIYVNGNASSDVTVVTAAGELSAAITGAADGDTIVLGTGTYTLTDLVTADLTIVGNGDVVIETAQNSAQQCGIYACGDLTIKGVTFKGMTNVAPCITTQTGAAITVKIEDCTFEVTNMGVYLNPGVTGGYIKNCTFKMATGSYAAIGVDGLAGNFVVSGNTFVGTGSHGYDVETFASNGSYLTVTGATVNPLP